MPVRRSSPTWPRVDRDHHAPERRGRLDARGFDRRPLPERARASVGSRRRVPADRGASGVPALEVGHDAGGEVHGVVAGAASVTTVPGARMSPVTSGVGRGVVVTTTRGCSRGGRPKRSWSKAPGSATRRARRATPRRAAGRGAGRPVGGVGGRDGPVGPREPPPRRVPLGRSPGGEMRRMPLSPSTTTSRTSEAVRATRAMRPAPRWSPCGEPTRRPCGSCPSRGRRG